MSTNYVKGLELDYVAHAKSCEGWPLPCQSMCFPERNTITKATWWYVRGTNVRPRQKGTLWSKWSKKLLLAECSGKAPWRRHIWVIQGEGRKGGIQDGRITPQRLSGTWDWRREEGWDTVEKKAERKGSESVYRRPRKPVLLFCR